MWSISLFISAIMLLISALSLFRSLFIAYPKTTVHLHDVYLLQPNAFEMWNVAFKGATRKKAASQEIMMRGVGQMDQLQTQTVSTWWPGTSINYGSNAFTGIYFST